MKRITVILIVVFSLLCAPVFAQEIYKLVTADYKLIVNGSELKSELPVLNYDGNTYLPLRKVSEAAGVNIQWDALNKQVIINSTGTSNILPTPLAALPTTDASVQPKQCKVFYSTNFFHKSGANELTGYDYKYYTKNNEIMLSGATWFASISKGICTIEIMDNKLIIKLGESEIVTNCTIELTAGTKACLIDNKEYILDEPPEKLGGNIYLPVNSLLKLKNEVVNKKPFFFLKARENSGNVYILEEFEEISG